MLLELFSNLKQNKTLIGDWICGSIGGFLDSKYQINWALVAHGYNSSTQEIEAGGSEIGCIDKASLVYMRPYLNRIK